MRRIVLVREKQLSVRYASQLLLEYRGEYGAILLKVMGGRASGAHRYHPVESELEDSRIRQRTQDSVGEVDKLKENREREQQP